MVMGVITVHVYLLTPNWPSVSSIKWKTQLFLNKANKYILISNKYKRITPNVLQEDIIQRLQEILTNQWLFPLFGSRVDRQLFTFKVSRYEWTCSWPWKLGSSATGERREPSPQTSGASCRINYPLAKNTSILDSALFITLPLTRTTPFFESNKTYYWRITPKFLQHST